jgi:hypothetical protein
MEFVYFTIAGLFLYVGADWVLLRIEAMYGKLLPNRSLFFFGIILIMTMIVFEIVQYLAPPAPPESSADGQTIAAPNNSVIPAAPTGPLFRDPDLGKALKE